MLRRERLAVGLIGEQRFRVLDRLERDVLGSDRVGGQVGCVEVAVQERLDRRPVVVQVGVGVRDAAVSRGVRERLIGFLPVAGLFSRAA
jgi:hypothetical protein